MLTVDTHHLLSKWNQYLCLHLKEVLTNVDKLFLLILELPERLTRQEFSLSQKNYDLAENYFSLKGNFYLLKRYRGRSPPN